MHIVVVGLNYRTAPVEIRERFAVAADQLSQAVKELKATKSVLECVIVGTCNRTELYAVVDREHTEHMQAFMASWFGIERKSFSPYLYTYKDDEAIRHLFRVACGLDSMVIGETQILGQVRSAFFVAQEEKTTGTIFNTLFRQAITVAKKAHSETAIGENAVSVSYAAVELGKRIFGSFDRKRVLIIGAGKMSELTVKHLNASGADRIDVVNRTLARAEELAEKFGGTAYEMDRLPELLATADVVISSTGSAETVLAKSDVERAMKRRPSRGLFLIDIAVPRDLDPAIHDVPNVYLYDIDDLEGIVEANKELRRQEAFKIEAMIGEGMEGFQQWYRTLGVGPVIRALQQKAAVIHDETMESMRNKLPELSEREWKVIRKLTKSMLNQLMHDPILRVKEMAPEKNGDAALEQFITLFALEQAMQEQSSTKPQRATSESSQPRASEPSGKRNSLSLV